MHRAPTRSLPAIVAGALLTLVVAGCGGGSDSAAEEPLETLTTPTETSTTTEAATTEEADTSSGGGPAVEGPVPAPGQGTLVLDDGRSFPITVTECEGEPGDTFSASGTSVDGSEFSFLNFYLSGSWSQSQASIEFPNEDQIYVIVGRLAEGAEPATVEGKSVTWVQTFRELDESANRTVYTGQGVLRLTCP
ncbi:MAG: hypothetical protein R6W48_08685 [Gaiellaceae bacterium]